MLQLLFICRYDPTLSLAEVETIRRDVWRRCDERDIGGFFLRNGSFLVGLLEGREEAVIGTVEFLIRKHKVTRVQVIREVSLDDREWLVWNKEDCDLVELSELHWEKFEGLAQIVKSAVDADRKGSLAH